jgi:OmpA-OmpF porin, OOP family
MKAIKKSAVLSCAIAVLTTSSVSLAQEQTQEGWYIGGNIGQSRAHVNALKIGNDVTPATFSTSYLGHNTIDSGYKLFAGYQFSDHFSLEGGYFDLGEHQFNFLSAPTGTVPAGLLNANMQVRGINLDVVGQVPFTEKLSAFARVGVNYALTQDTFTGAGTAAELGGKLSDRDTFGKAGVGLQYAFNDAWAMRVEGERYRVSNGITDHNEVDLYSVGLVYRFGAKPAPAPAPVVTPPPAPAPVVAAPPPAPRFEKYTLSSTELFGFDSDALQLPQPKLDEIAEALKGEGAPREIQIVGYTDRLGSPAYNQKLSERRATSVKNYLVSKGVEGSRLQTIGKGEADPVVQCNETKKAALIECLKPNRRVEIDQITVTRQVTP